MKVWNTPKDLLWELGDNEETIGSFNLDAAESESTAKILSKRWNFQVAYIQIRDDKN